MNLDKIEKLYSDNIKAYGIDSRAVGWNSSESQILRFEKLLKIIKAKDDSFTINELGCGYGELFKFLEKSDFNLSQFKGYDISEPMLEKCKEYIGKTSKLQLYNSSKLKTVADYTITSGIFNTPFDNKVIDWEAYIKKTIIEMYAFSNKGIAFNFLTTAVDFRNENLFYQDPSKMLSFCLKKFGKNVTVLHDYELFEFTVLVFKTNYALKKKPL